MFVRTVAGVGSNMQVQFPKFAELGAGISWLRAGYLTLFAVAGYQVCGRCGPSPREHKCPHGTSAQRAEWLRRGLETGRGDACNTLRGVS